MYVQKVVLGEKKMCLIRSTSLRTSFCWFLGIFGWFLAFFVENTRFFEEPPSWATRILFIDYAATSTSSQEKSGMESRMALS